MKTKDISKKEFKYMALLLMQIKIEHCVEDNFSGTTKCPFCKSKVAYAFLNHGYDFKSIKCANEVCQLNQIWKKIELVEKEKKK